MKAVTLDKNGCIAHIEVVDEVRLGAINLDDTFEGEVGEPWANFNSDGTRKLVPDYVTMRKEAYAKETDALLFEALRGERSLDDWKEAVARIKKRYPKT